MVIIGLILMYVNPWGVGWFFGLVLIFAGPVTLYNKYIVDNYPFWR